MYCTHCGTKIAKDSKYCQKCGKAVGSTNNKQEGTIRKSIKKDAILKEKTPLVITMIIITAISLFLPSGVNLLYSNTLYAKEILAPLESLVEFIIIIGCSIVLSFGITGAAIDISRDKKVTITDVIIKPFKNIKSVALYYLIIFMAMVIYITTLLIPGINILIILLSIIVLPILIVYFYPVLDMTIYLIMDDQRKQTPFLETLKEAYELLKGRRVEYYGMLFSFIGWFLLAIVTLGILFIWLTPYIKISMSNMYRNWIGETTFEEEKGLTNGTIIGLTIGGYFIATFFITMLIAFIILIFDYDSEYYDDSYDYHYYHEYYHHM